MLEALRRGSAGWVAKILLSLLILSFAVWGIADVFTGFGRGSLAKVGTTEITATEFNRVLQNEIEGLSAEYGKRITVEDARREGVDRFVLNKLIGQAALREHAQVLKLGMSKDLVASNLKADADFAGPDGKFSKDGFDNLLRNLGLSEARFLQLRKDDELRRQLSSAMLSATVTPKAMVDITHGWRNETRSLEFFKIDAAKAVTVPEPTEDKLNAFYDEQKTAYMTPEFRKFGALVATIDDLKAEAVITDEQVKASYADTKHEYDKPERRRIQQIAFKDKAAADAAREALIKGGKNFMDVAKEMGAKESDVNLGLLSKTQLIDPKIAEAAFKVERDAVSEVIEGRFATVILRVIEVQTGEESTLDKVKDKVRDRLARGQASDLLQKRADLVEEGRNAGKSLKELGQELKLKFFDVAQSDRDNKTADGKTALDLTSAPSIIATVFQTAPGTESEPVQLSSEGYAWYDVTSVEEPQQKPLADVKDEVKAAFIAAEKSKLIKEFADKLAERAKAGDDFAKIAAEAGGTVEKLDSILRNTSPPGLTQESVEFAFVLPSGGAASAETTDRGTRNVIKVVKITPPGAPSKADEDKLTAEIQRNLQNDQLIAYVSTLQDKLGVTINEVEFKRATGADVAP